MTTKQKLDKFFREEYEWILRNVKKNIAYGPMATYANDLVQEMVIQTYGMKEDRIEEMLENGKLKWYILSGSGMQLRSYTSPFWHTHRKQKMSSREFGLVGSTSNIFDRIDDTEELSTETLYDCMMREIENLHWYNKTLLNEYWINGMKLDDLHKKYQIGKVHLTRDLNKGILQIREACKDCDE